jgi:hypothetical protein
VFCVGVFCGTDLFTGCVCVCVCVCVCGVLYSLY